MSDYPCKIGSKFLCWNGQITIVTGFQRRGRGFTVCLQWEGVKYGVRCSWTQFKNSIKEEINDVRA